MVQGINTEKAQNGKKNEFDKNVSVFRNVFLHYNVLQLQECPWFSYTALCKITGGKNAIIHYQYWSIELAAVFSIDIMIFFDN